MVCCCILAAVFAAIAYFVFFRKPAPKPELPKLDANEWWGPNELKGKADDSIKPFKVEFKDDMIKDLRQRLANHRSWTPPLEGTAFEYGFNSNQLNSWLEYWKDQYNFSEREKFFNQFPHFKTNIQGLDIHFIRVKPEVQPGVQVLPMLLLHGWPGSVREFYEAIPLLTHPAPGYNFAFEVIVPSLPGYGFSDAAVRPGLASTHVAVIMRNLMQRLGFNQYYIQGGDWGSVITLALATLYPNEVLGYHSNMAFTTSPKVMGMMFLGSYIPSLVSKTVSRVYPLSKYLGKMLEETGYMHIQATRPDTVGIGLSDSPAGLLAYILEKFSVWTKLDDIKKQDGGLSFWSKEQLLDNLMLYWSTEKITSSMRLYAENFSKKHRELKLDAHTTPVPTWVLQTKEELYYTPEKLLKYKFDNLVGVTMLNQGGHFTAFEIPQLFAEDVFKGIEAIRSWRAQNGV